jgi:hypothetical protein
MGATTAGAGAFRSLSVTPIGIQLYNTTASYIPTPLNHYEELNTTLTFGGIWSQTYNVNIYLTRIGRIVNFTLNFFTQIGAQTGNTVLTTNALPVRFRPFQNSIYKIYIQDNTPFNGNLIIFSNGQVGVERGDNGPFIGVGDCGWGTTSVSYIV